MSHVLGNPWSQFVAWLYLGPYRNGLSRLGGFRKAKSQTTAAAEGVDEATGPNLPGESSKLQAVDARATDMGNLYRGYGLLVALFFTGVLWTELFPHNKAAFGLRLLFMALIALLVIYVNKFSNLRDGWKKERITAERLRYRELESSLQIHANNECMLSKACQLVLDEQIKYNERCRDQYHGIELVTNIIVTIAFIALFVFTLFELFLHDGNEVPNGLEVLWSVLRFMPAGAIGLLVFNAFINLWKLMEDHEELVDELTKLRGELANKPRTRTVSELAEEIRQTLYDRDNRWAKHVDGMSVKLGG